MIEALSQKSYAQTVTERVLTPLKMTRSTFYPTTAMTYPFSQGHLSAGKQQWTVVRPYDDTAERWPSGFLFSSVYDLSRFVIAFMNDGRIDGEQVLSPEGIALLSQSHTRPFGSSNDGGYGYGLGLGSYRGVHIIGHGGGRRGFVAELRMAPLHRFAFIQLLNHQGSLLEKTKQKAMEMLLPLQEQATPSPSPALPMTEAELQRFVGRYDPPIIDARPEQTIELTINNGSLALRFGSTGKLLPVTRTSDTRFTVNTGPNRPSFTFVFRLGENKQEDYLCAATRAYKRIA